MFNFVNIKRKIKNFYQRQRYGFCGEDLYSLDWHLAKLILPRIKAFRNTYTGSDEFEQIIEKIVKSMEFCADESNLGPCDREDIQEGLSLFGENFRSLWF